MELWKSISPPNPESDVIQKWHGVIYQEGKKSKLYVGKALNRFLEDENGKVSEILIDCLIPPVGTSNIHESVPENRDRDVAPFKLHDIIGQIDVEPLPKRKWRVPLYDDLKKSYAKVVDIDRSLLASSI